MKHLVLIMGLFALGLTGCIDHIGPAPALLEVSQDISLKTSKGDAIKLRAGEIANVEFEALKTSSQLRLIIDDKKVNFEKAKVGDDHNSLVSDPAKSKQDLNAEKLGMRATRTLL